MGSLADRNDKRDSYAAYERRNVAVALSYELGSKTLPRVVATGRGAIADQIIKLAFANGVRVREDADLAEMLSVVDIDSEIPIEAITAVAEILSYLYRAGQLRRANTAEASTP